MSVIDTGVPEVIFITDSGLIKPQPDSGILDETHASTYETKSIHDMPTAKAHISANINYHLCSGVPVTKSRFTNIRPTSRTVPYQPMPFARIIDSVASTSIDKIANPVSSVSRPI